MATAMENFSEAETASVNFKEPRSFGAILKSDLKETLFADDPFHGLKGQPTGRRVLKVLQYYVPILEWLPNYDLKNLRYDVVAGITIASLSVPQGISYAKMADIPPIIGLYCSFIPPLIYAMFGSSKCLAIGNMAAPTLIIAAAIKQINVFPETDPKLYVNLIITAGFLTGVMQLLLGVCRLGLLVNFLSHSTSIGFMAGTATIICLQQLKGLLGMKHFTKKTDVVNVIITVFKYRHEWRWLCAVLGAIYLTFLLYARRLGQKHPKLQFISTSGPMVVVVTGCLITYFTDVEKYGIQTVGPLKRGFPPITIGDLTFDSKYISGPIKAAIISGALATSEAVAMGRSFALKRNEETDGNKEMIAFGLMNIIGSFTSTYLTSGIFSKTAVNFNAGCKTMVSDIVMGLCIMLVILFLAPIFSYTPLVALAAIIASAMIGLLKFGEIHELYKVDKFDFLICMVGFLGVAFISMDIGLFSSFILSLVRGLLYLARPATCKLGNIPDSTIYRDNEQYPQATGVPGIVVVQLGSPVYFANGVYIKERIMRWIRDEQNKSMTKEVDVQHLLLEMGGVTAVDMTGIQALMGIRKQLLGKGIKMGIVNPRVNVLEKLMLAKVVDIIGKESFYLSIEDAINKCRFSLDQDQTPPDKEDCV